MGQKVVDVTNAWPVQLIAEAESKLHLPNILKHEAAQSGSSGSTEATEVEKHADTQAPIAPHGVSDSHAEASSQKADSPARYLSYSKHKLMFSPSNIHSSIV